MNLGVGSRSARPHGDDRGRSGWGTSWCSCSVFGNHGLARLDEAMADDPSVGNGPRTSPPPTETRRRSATLGSSDTSDALRPWSAVRAEQPVPLRHPWPDLRRQKNGFCHWLAARRVTLNELRGRDGCGAAGVEQVHGPALGHVDGWREDGWRVVSGWGHLWDAAS